MKCKAYTREISVTGMVLFVLREGTNDRFLDDVSITMREDIANYLVKLVEEDQKRNEHKRRSTDND